MGAANAMAGSSDKSIAFATEYVCDMGSTYTSCYSNATGRQKLPFQSGTVLSFQVCVRDNEEKPGVWGRQRDTAKHLGLSTKTVNEIVQQLCWIGALKRLSFPTRAPIATSMK